MSSRREHGTLPGVTPIDTGMPGRIGKGNTDMEGSWGYQIRAVARREKKDEKRCTDRSAMKKKMISVNGSAHGKKRDSWTSLDENPKITALWQETF